MVYCLIKGAQSGYINNSRHLARKYARIFVRGHYLFREATSYASYEEQIMSKDKNPITVSPQMATIVFIILQIFFATRAVLEIGEYSRIFPSFSWGIFGHVTRLDQSRASEKIWWIIINNYSPQCRWLVVDIYRAAKRRGKYPTLATDTEVNSCFSIY